MEKLHPICVVHELTEKRNRSFMFLPIAKTKKQVVPSYEVMKYMRIKGLRKSIYGFSSFASRSEKQFWGCKHKHKHL